MGVFITQKKIIDTNKLFNLAQRKFLVFINPISGNNDKNKLKKIVCQCIEDIQIPYEILTTIANGNYNFLAEKITSENISDIIICGGDGTIGYIVKHILTIKVAIGIVPMGSGNGLAFTAGIPRSPKLAMQIIINNKPKYVDAFWVNKIFACHNFGVGFDATVAHQFANSTKRGPLSYIKLTAKNFFSAKPYNFLLTTNNETLTVKAFFVAVLNSNQFGNSLTIAPKASLHDGLLDVVIVKKDNKLSLFVKLLMQLKNGKVAHVNDYKKTIQYLQTELISLTNPANAPLHVDGEPVATQKNITISIQKRAYLLHQPV